MADTPAWQREIIGLHDFFQGWLDGSLPNEAEQYARLETAVADQFVLISPDGRTTTRTDLLEQLRSAHGSRPGWRMWIEQAELRVQSDGLIVATYHEWQESGEHRNARLSTVVFREHAPAPNGLLWLHVHETWLP